MGRGSGLSLAASKLVAPQRHPGETGGYFNRNARSQDKLCIIFKLFCIGNRINTAQSLPTLYQTLLQALDKNTFRQVLADEYDFAAS